MTQPLSVLATKKFFPLDIEYISAGLGSRAQLVFPEEYTSSSIAAAADQADVLLGGLVTREILSAAPALKLVQIPWTGVDTLDFTMLSEFSVPICNSHSNAQAVAEYAVALMLAATKQLATHDRLLRQGKWGRPTRDGTGFFQPPLALSGMVAGFVGTGAIGTATARLLNAFGMECRGTGYVDENTTDEVFTRIDHPDTLLTLAAEVDILFITVPLVPATTGMVNNAVFAAMKPEAFLVSISRGAIIDPSALYQALQESRIAGAAIDTWYNYPTIDQPETMPSLDYPFHELDNLVMSPHRAGFLAGQMPHLDDAITNINRLADGLPLINRVDVEAGF